MDEGIINLKLMVVLSKLLKSIESNIVPEIRDKGLTFTQFTVLEAIYNKGPQSVNDVIKRAHSSSGNMGLVINNLLKSGLIVKEVSILDRRARTLKLTKKGIEIIKNLYPKHVIKINKIMQGLALNEKETLISLIKKLGYSIEGS